jgi:hypothetical protein
MSSTWYIVASVDLTPSLVSKVLVSPAKRKYIQQNIMSMSDDDEDAYEYDDEVEDEVEGDACSALDLDVRQFKQLQGDEHPDNLPR